MSKITFKRPDEENLDVYVDGEHVGNVNHDDHGWSGMQSAEDLVRRIAEALKIEVTDEEFDDAA
jgi:hypothetical protein